MKRDERNGAMEHDQPDTIDRGSSVPIYRQLKEIIKRRIARGEFRPGERISTEYELCREFSISRTSVRQALAELTQEGYLYRHQGSGTFVNHRDGGRHATVRVMIPEAHWAPYLRRAAAAVDGVKPQVEIEVLGRPHLRDKLLAAVGRGDAPDLALIDWAWVAEFANLHFLTPLDKLDSHWIEKFRGDLFPAFRNDPLLPTYGIQPEASVSTLWYRKDWFKQAGLPPPHTWDDLVRACIHFKQAMKFPLAFVGGICAGETTTYQLLPFIWSAGGEFLLENKVSLGAKAVRALSFLVDLVHKYHVASPDVVSFEWDKPARLFAQGQVAVAVGGSYEKALIQKVSGWDEKSFRRRVGCVPIPASTGGQSASIVGGMVYVIFQQSKNARLALEILQRVVSPPLIHEFCTKTGRTPTRISVAQTLDPEKDWFSYQVSQFLQTARSRPAISQYAKASEQFQLMVENAITRRMSPQAAADEARKIIEALIS